MKFQACFLEKKKNSKCLLKCLTIMLSVKYNNAYCARMVPVVCNQTIWTDLPDHRVSILHKYIGDRYRPVMVADGPIKARCRFINNASWGANSAPLYENFPK